MAKTTVTIQGNLCADPVQRTGKSTGTVFTTMRVASTPRRLDRVTGELVDEPTSYYNVTCFRALARNAARSLRCGQPVVISGTLTVREWQSEERRGVSADVIATAIGHDLTFGVAEFARVGRPKDETPAETEVPDEQERGDVEEVLNAQDHQSEELEKVLDRPAQDESDLSPVF